MEVALVVRINPGLPEEDRPVTPRAGEIVLAIKLRTPLTTLADVIHPLPTFNRVLGQNLDELAAKVAPHSPARS